MSHSECNGDCTFTKMAPLFPRLFITSGIRAKCEEARCFWFVDIIGSTMCLRPIQTEGFQVWSLHRMHDGDPIIPHLRPDDLIWRQNRGMKGCIVVASDGNEECEPTIIPPVSLYRQRVHYTDFPEDFFKAYAVWQGLEDGELPVLVVMLPEEY